MEIPFTGISREESPSYVHVDWNAVFELWSREGKFGFSVVHIGRWELLLLCPLSELSSGQSLNSTQAASVCAGLDSLQRSPQ